MPSPRRLDPHALPAKPTQEDIRLALIDLWDEVQELNYPLQAAQGKKAGVTTLNKFGRTQNADNGVATDVHDGADGGNVIWDAPTAARNHTIVSGNIADDAASGQGAWTVKIWGLTSWTSAESSETVTMDGTVGVTTVNDYVIIHRMRVITYGTSGPNVGAITATAATDSTVTAQILAGNGQTGMAIYGVPTGYTLFLTAIYASLLKATPANTTCNIALLCNEEADAFATGYVNKHTEGLDSVGTNNSDHKFEPPKSLAGPCIVKIQALASADNTDVSAGFDGYVIKD